MIKLQGWEENEYMDVELSKDEILIAHELSKFFMLYFVGPHNCRTNKQIQKYYNAKGYKLNDIRVRRIIRYIRLNNMVPFLVASAKGYYRTTDQQDILRFLESCRQRERAQKEMRQAIEKQYIVKYGKQLTKD